MWKCTECGTEIDGNYCSECKISRIDNEALQPIPVERLDQESKPEEGIDQEPMPVESLDQETMPEERIEQEPMHEEGFDQHPMPEEGIYQESVAEGETIQPDMPENTHQQPIAEEKSSRKGCVIAVIVIVAVIALLITVISLSVNMILGGIRNNLEDRDIETEVYNGEVTRTSDRTSPFNFEVWYLAEFVQIELGEVVLDVPIPPNAVILEDIGDCTVFLGAEDERIDWFFVQVTLRNAMRSDFGRYFAGESEFNLEWHSEWAEILDKQEFEEEDVGLMITHWDDGWYDGYTFTKISQYENFVLLTEIRFVTPENREELFEVYGFMDHFGEIIRSALTGTLND
jgi:hypothetical protein